MNRYFCTFLYTSICTYCTIIWCKDRIYIYIYIPSISACISTNFDNSLFEYTVPNSSPNTLSGVPDIGRLGTDTGVGTGVGTPTPPCLPHLNYIHIHHLYIIYILCVQGFTNKRHQKKYIPFTTTIF